MSIEATVLNARTIRRVLGVTPKTSTNMDVGEAYRDVLVASLRGQVHISRLRYVDSSADHPVDFLYPDRRSRLVWVLR